MGPGRHPQSTAEFLYFLEPEGFTYEYSFGARRIEDAAASVPRHSDFAKGYLVAGASIAAAVGAWMVWSRPRGFATERSASPRGEFLVGRGDVLLGEIDGCPFSIDDALDVALRHDRFVLDGTTATRRASRCQRVRGGASSPAPQVASAQQHRSCPDRTVHHVAAFRPPGIG
jgi:hypothetical protein